MELIGIIFVLIAVLLLGVGMAIGLVACVAGSVLVGAGVLSSSVLVGFWRRRTLAGVQAFFVQCGILAGAPAGAVCAWAAAQVWPALHAQWHLLAAGAAGGVVAGLGVALLASVASACVLNRVLPWLTAKVTVFHRVQS